MKLLRTIRLDPSDTFVFEKAAEPGEWAVSGAFEFWHTRCRRARRQGALGVSRRLPRRRFVRLVDSGADRRGERQTTAAPSSIGWRKQLVANFGAPDIDAARAAAEEEVAFAESLCTQPQDTLVAVHRSFENGDVRETFRTLRPREGQKPARAFSFLEVEGENDEPGEQVDLIGMAGRERK